MQVPAWDAIGHSMGSRLLALALANHEVLRGEGDVPHRIIFAAADCQQQEFCGLLQAARRNRVECVLLSSARDEALQWSKKIHSALPIL